MCVLSRDSRKCLFQLVMGVQFKDVHVHNHVESIAPRVVPFSAFIVSSGQSA